MKTKIKKHGSEKILVKNNFYNFNYFFGEI